MQYSAVQYRVQYSTGTAHGEWVLGTDAGPYLELGLAAEDGGYHDGLVHRQQQPETCNSIHILSTIDG